MFIIIVFLISKWCNTKEALKYISKDKNISVSADHLAST